MPEISIIVPVYNVKEYLEECIKSLIEQTFRDIEIILVDDGSTDNSGKICDFFASQDTRIHVIHKENSGLSSARNTGILVAKGNYICFVDSDDFISLDYCNTLYNLLNGTNYDFSMCGVQRFQEKTDIKCKNKNFYSIYSIANKDLLFSQIQKKYEFGVWNKLYKKYIFDKILFKNGKLNEDVIFSTDLSLHFTNGVICTDEKLYYYRQRKNSIVSKQSLKGSPDRVYAGEYLLEAVKKIDIDMIDQSFYYAFSYPWSFLDSIVVQHQFYENEEFINLLQITLKRNIDLIKSSTLFSNIQKHRMLLFAKSKILFYINAYIRLVRVYFFRIIKKDPYKTGHGI